MSDRDERQFFANRPSSLLDLVDQLVEANLDGIAALANPDAEMVHALKAEEIHSEIRRRLAEVEKFGGTEATCIQSIIATGTDRGVRP